MTAEPKLLCIRKNDFCLIWFGIDALIAVLEIIMIILVNVNSEEGIIIIPMVQVIILICFGFLMTGVYRELEFAGVLFKETSYRNPNHLMPMIVLEICRAIFNLVSGAAMS